VDIDFTFSDALTAGLERGAAAHLDFSPVMGAISELMAGAVEERFDKEEDPNAIPWLPSQRKLKEGGKTLQIRGVAGGLLGNLLGNAGFDSFASWIGTNLPYARSLHGGATIRPRADSGKKALKTPFGPRGRVDIPARPIVGFGHEELEEIPLLLGDFLGDAYAGGAA
jgi:phage gpG-like protein